MYVKTSKGREIRVKDQNLLDVLNGKATLIEDGAFGTQLIARGVVSGSSAQNPDVAALDNSDVVRDIHADYIRAGARIITSATFNTNKFKIDSTQSVEQIYASAISNVRAAINMVSCGEPVYIAGDIGPIGQLLEPIGSLTFDEAYDAFAECARAAAKAGADVIYIETMSDLREAKAALLAAVDNCDLPVFVTMTFQDDGRTFTGTTPQIAAATLSAAGASAIGINCSLGPAEVADLIAQAAPYSRCPLIAKPNAGLPQIIDRQTHYDVSPSQFGEGMTTCLASGASIVGGCCGTTPAHIAALTDSLAQVGFDFKERYAKKFVIAGPQKMVELDEGSPNIVVVGERINPTGKKVLKAALLAGELEPIVALANEQEQAGADVLDVNVGLPGIDEPAVMAQSVELLLSTTQLPLQIDSSDVCALERAVRAYPGKPSINSVNGKESNMDAVLPLVARYGATIVGLTLDEAGIPETAQGRFEIAERIVNRALACGISREDIAIDCLTMSAASSPGQPLEILQALRMVKERLGVRTVLGVSNVSHGLPARPVINAAFLSACFGAGLDLAIINPSNARMLDAVYTWRMLSGQDESCRSFVERFAEWSEASAAGVSAAGPNIGSDSSKASASDVSNTVEDTPAARVSKYVLSGQASAVASEISRLLKDGQDPNDIVCDILMPPLDEVSLRYDQGKFFLPQLLSSSEAVKAGFDIVRAHVLDSADSDTSVAAGQAGSGNKIVLATVEGDIHDIGKNIVKMLLQNYGFDVIDLGKDVSPQTVVDAVLANDVHFVGLSALMTTTVPAMAKTIELLGQVAPDVVIVVGGAVLTADYAAKINATHYAKDASETVAIAKQFFGQ